MNKFRVIFEGTGYNFFTEDGQPIRGFFVSVIANASSPENAVDVAYHVLTNSQEYLELYAQGSHPNAKLSMSEYFELSEDEPDTPEVSGFVFYKDEDEERMNTAH